jgi:hypothetical protein
VLGLAGAGGTVPARLEDGPREEDPPSVPEGPRRLLPPEPTVKPPRGVAECEGEVGLLNGMASTTPGLRSPAPGEVSPPMVDALGMKPSTATPVKVSEDTAATAAAGAPERTAIEALAEPRWWRAARDVARRLMSSSRSGVHWTDRGHPVGRGTARWSDRGLVGLVL